MSESHAEPVAATPLPFIDTGEPCTLRDRTALVIVPRPEEWRAIADCLGELGLSVRSCEASGPAPLAPGEPVDLVVLDAGLDPAAAFAAIDALVKDRPWVPLIASLGDGRAVRIRSDDCRLRVPSDEAPGGARPLRRMVAQALCRRARHTPERACCVAVQPT